MATLKCLSIGHFRVVSVWPDLTLYLTLSLPCCVGKCSEVMLRTRVGIRLGIRLGLTLGVNLASNLHGIVTQIVTNLTLGC